MQKYVILHNIRSAHNVGSIMRTADGAGVSKIWLTGYTPAPIDRFGRERQEIKKTSLGASKTVVWEQTEHIRVCVALLKKQGCTVVAVEQDTRAIEYQSFVMKHDTAFIFGNETEGLPADVIEASDVVLHIPMHGTKESLNVSVAAGIILFAN